MVEPADLLAAGGRSRARLTPVEDIVSETQGRLAFTHDTMVSEP